MVWLGARTTVNPFYVQEVAESLQDSKIHVYIKIQLFLIWTYGTMQLKECRVTILKILEQYIEVFCRKKN